VGDDGGDGDALGAGASDEGVIDVDVDCHWHGVILCGRSPRPKGRG
jgi:hypothetical protein